MSNPYSAFFGKKLKESLGSVKRVDKDGKFYAMDYTANYYGLASLPVKAIGIFKSGCSAFICKTKSGAYLTGRNYDMPHKDKNGNVFGVNLMLHCKPAGKYESLAGVDAVWLSVLKIDVKEGCLDDGKTKISGLALMPYLCMDGINEKGLSVSILALDLKKGEAPVKQNDAGKKKVIITMLVRYILDSCKDLDEAIKLTQNYNLVNTLGKDYHLFVSDAQGNSAVFEWRYNKFTVIKTDCVTNCYVCEDDACDCYYGEDLKEKYVPLDIKPTKEYHFGYGHGYERYKTVIKALENKRDSDTGFAKMDEQDAMEVLKSVSQDYDGMLTSFTQYSVVYDHENLSATFCIQKDYEHKYTFSLK